MDDKTPKYSTVIDFLFPFDMSYFFTSKKMETSIKVIILPPGCKFSVNFCEIIFRCGENVGKETRKRPSQSIEKAF